MLCYRRNDLRCQNLEGEFGIGREDEMRLTPQIEEALRRVVDKYDEGRLGFLETPEQALEPIESFANRAKQTFKKQLLIGIGGSSLGARAICRALPDKKTKGLQTEFLENVDPDRIDRVVSELDIENTLVTVVTKSGTTLETMTKFAYLYKEFERRLGAEKASEHFVAITGPRNEGLRRIAQDYNLTAFDVPSNTGGRFSVLTPVGLVPLSIAGINTEQLIRGAEIARSVGLTEGPETNPVLQASTDIYELYRRGITELVMISYAERFRGLVEWFRQLWAESLGKVRSDGRREGMTPVASVGTVDQHSQLQLYMEGPPRQLVSFLELESFGAAPKVPAGSILPGDLKHLEGTSFRRIFQAELEATRRALRDDANRPTTTWKFTRGTAREIGGFIMTWELITALTAEMIDVNAYNQPGVEAGKTIANRILAGESDFEKTPTVGEWSGGVVVESEDR